MPSIFHRRPIRVMSTANAPAGADGVMVLASAARILGQAGNPGFTALNWNPVESNGWEHFENRLAARLYQPRRIRHRGGACSLRPAGCARPIRRALQVLFVDAATRLKTTLGEMCFGLLVGSVGPGFFQGLLHSRPEPAVVAGRVRAWCRCLFV